jgi:hypothetical protein
MANHLSCLIKKSIENNEDKEWMLTIAVRFRIIKKMVKSIKVVRT